MRALLFIPLLLLCGELSGQAPAGKPWHVNISSGIQYNFGASSAEAMLVGGVDTAFPSRYYTYRPGYSSSVPLELEFAYAGFKNLMLESAIGYQRINTGIVEEFYLEEFDWMQLDMISFRASALLMMGGRSVEKPNRLLVGASFKGMLPVKVTENRQTTTRFGIEEFDPAMQITFTIDAKFHYYLYKNLLFLSPGFSIDMPTSIFEAAGETGKVTLSPDAGYTLKNNTIKMYSFEGSIGIGYRFGQIKPE